MTPPKVTTKVIGFRVWTLRDGKLYSGNSVFGHWERGVNKAECRRDKFPPSYLALMPSSYWTSASSHYPEQRREKPKPKNCTHAPAQDCNCGLYAYHDLASRCPEGFDDEPEDGTVYGAVAAWGKMEVHHNGFRAEYAEPVVLAYGDHFTLRSVEAIREYGRQAGIKVVPVSELEEYALTHGQPVAAEHRPERLTTKDFGYAAQLSRRHAQLQRYYGGGYISSPVATWTTSSSIGYAPPPKRRWAGRFPWWNAGAVAFCGGIFAFDAATHSLFWAAWLNLGLAFLNGGLGWRWWRRQS